MRWISRVFERWYCRHLVREARREAKRAAARRKDLWANVCEAHQWASELGGDAPYRSGMVRVIEDEEVHPLWQ